jgi:pimeloyl-ACP methyl ester carboxylesterase
MQNHQPARRRFLLAAGATAAGAAAAALPAAAMPGAASAVPTGDTAAGAPLSSARAGAMPLQHIDVGALDVAYYSGGPEAGRPVVLLHDHFDSIDSLAELAGLLAVQGLRVLVPQLRGHGETAFKDPAAPRAALPAALGKDAIGLIDALHMPEAVFAGIGWGATAARAAAAFKPTRCIGIALAQESQPVASAAVAPPAGAVPTLTLASLDPRAIADAIATLVRQGKWRT